MSSVFWDHYCSPFTQKIMAPSHAGLFTDEQRVQLSNDKKQYLSVQYGNVNDEYLLFLSVFLSLETEKITDLRFQVFGHAVLIGLMQLFCEKMLNQPYQQLLVFREEQLRQWLQAGSFVKPPFFEENRFFFSMITELALLLAKKCPATSALEEEVPQSNWNELSAAEKRKRVEMILQRDILPFIQRDGGHVKIKRIQGNTITIAYQGACTSCPSAIGGTLSTIQSLLNQQLDPSLRVEVDRTSLQFLSSFPEEH